MIALVDQRHVMHSMRKRKSESYINMNALLHGRAINVAYY